MGGVTEDDVLQLVRRLPDVHVFTASEADGAPEVAWGDSFVYYDPSGRGEDTHGQPFATIVTKDYEGWDTASALNRSGVFRVNVAVGREIFAALFGHAPAAHADHYGDYDYTALDRVIPHPVYAGQGWVSVLNPQATAPQLESLLAQAHARAAARHRRRAAH
jgi:Family of unknown function (DUF6194)